MTSCDIKLVISDAYAAIERLSTLNVKGISKLQRKMLSEIKVLEKVLDEPEVLKKKLECSNVTHLKSIVNVCMEVSNVSGVLQPFKYVNGKLIVDIEADSGRQWIKVICRNPEALHHSFLFGRRGHVRPLTEVGEDFLLCAQENKVYFELPEIIFKFTKGVSDALGDSLASLGIHVDGTRISAFSYETASDSSDMPSICSGNYEDISDDVESIPVCDNGNKNCNEEFTCINKINVDISTMVAFVSETTNGGCNFIFESKFLTEQASDERLNPVKPAIEEYFKDHELIACEEAVKHFFDILSAVGGKNEKQRGRELVSRLTVVPGCDVLKDEVKCKGGTTELSRIIFGTGLFHRAVTVTANGRFVRSVKQQGINIPVYFHQARGLTEAKQANAEPIYS